MSFRLALVAALVATGCDRKANDPVPATPPAKPAPVTLSDCTLAAIPTVIPGIPKRLVAIGDLHGDLHATRAALKAAGAIDDKDTWVGGDLVLVQTGDILDRGDDESKIFALFETLTAQANAAGGQIVMLNGNHELMNASHDFRYVTPGGMSDFGGDRAAAFAPGGAWSKKLAAHNIVAIVDGNVFSHAGVVPEWVTHVEDETLAARCWLSGAGGSAEDRPRMLESEESPVWTREYGIAEKLDCARLGDALGKLGAKRMIVGHTPQEQGITSACDGKLWRIDVGLAAKYGGPIQALQLLPEPKILEGTR